MKKLKVLVLAVLAMASTSAIAQSSPWWFEGQFDVTYAKAKGADATTDFNIGVGANYKLTNEWSVGANIRFDKWDNGLADGNMFYVTPQVVYSKPMWGRMTWTPTCQLTLGFGDETVIGLGVDLLAFEYRISEHWALGMACDLGKVGFVSNDWGSDFGFQLGKNASTLGNMGFRFGFHFYL